MNELRHAFRRLMRSPGFTVVAVLTLALGIGVNTSMFAAFQALLMRTLPYPEGNELVQVFGTSPRSTRESHSVPNFLDQRTRNGALKFMAAFTGKPFNLAEAGQPAERVEGLQVSADFFPLLGVPPLLGRPFAAEEDQPSRNNVVILSHDFWLLRFAGDTNIVGRTLRLDGEGVTVIGVMPARFRDIMLSGPVSLWRPIAFTDDQKTQRGHQFLKVIARIRPGTTLAEAQASTEVTATGLSRDFPENNTAMGLRLVSLSESTLPTEGRIVVWSLMGLAGFVLLIACANLANLQFARTSHRVRELAIRSALGASRVSLIRQLLVESLLVAAIGGLVGVLLAGWGNEILSRQFVIRGQRLLTLPLDLKVLGFALVVSTLAGVAFGLVPALLASRTDVSEALKQGSRGTTGDQSNRRWQHSLIVAEVALALVLLTGAGLLGRGLSAFTNVDPGWRVDGMSLGYVTLPESRYGTGDAQRAFVDRLLEKLATLPGAENVSVGWTIPIRQFNVTSGFNIAGRPEAPKGHAPVCFVNGISPGYFKTLGIRLISGRDFTANDTTNRPSVVIINESMARAFWPGESPLGKFIDSDEVVGVVNDVRFPANPGEWKTSYQTYRPFAQAPRNWLAIAVRGIVSVEALRKTVASIDPDQPVGEAGTASDAIASTMANWQFGGHILNSFAVLGISLAALGIYGVISGFVARRTGEIGMRMALGAQVRDVLTLILGIGLRLSLIGTMIGLLGAFGLAKLLASVLPGLPASHPFVVLALAAVLVGITLLACWLPAHRASRVDPMVALRME
jgi:putative ABC transport system permease protein